MSNDVNRECYFGTCRNATIGVIERQCSNGNLFRTARRRGYCGEHVKEMFYRLKSIPGMRVVLFRYAR